MENNNNVLNPQSDATTNEVSTQPIQTPEAEKPKELTVGELRRGYIHLPKAFFTRRLRSLQFGSLTLTFLKRYGLGSEAANETVPVMGLILALDLNPVEIAVYSYLCFNSAASFKEISRQRAIDKGLIGGVIDDLMDLGLVTPNAVTGRWDVTTLEEIEASAGGEVLTNVDRG